MKFWVTIRMQCGSKLTWAKANTSLGFLVTLSRSTVTLSILTFKRHCKRNTHNSSSLTTQPLFWVETMHWLYGGLWPIIFLTQSYHWNTRYTFNRLSRKMYSKFMTVLRISRSLAKYAKSHSRRYLMHPSYFTQKTKSSRKSLQYILMVHMPFLNPHPMINTQRFHPYLKAQVTSNCTVILTTTFHSSGRSQWIILDQSQTTIQFGTRSNQILGKCWLLASRTQNSNILVDWTAVSFCSRYKLETSLDTVNSVTKSTCGCRSTKARFGSERITTGMRLWHSIQTVIFWTEEETEVTIDSHQSVLRSRMDKIGLMQSKSSLQMGTHFKREDLMLTLVITFLRLICPERYQMLACYTQPILLLNYLEYTSLIVKMRR